MSSDPGWFGPDSVTWRVHAHPSALVGGLRALLVQTLHPLAMAGVAQHSTYETDPLGRFHRTARFVTDTTYGTSEEAERAIARVRAIHPHIRGVAPDGRAYDASDPALLSWVHNVEVSSILAAYRRFGPGLDDASADRYVEEMLRVGAAVGADELPTTAREVDNWIARHPERGATADARRAVRYLLLPKLPPLLLPPYSVLSAAAVSLLPIRDRIALRVPSFPPIEPFVVVPTTKALLVALRAVLGPAPARAAALARVGAAH